MFRKIISTVGLVADAAPGALLVAAGLALFVAGLTGMSWY